MSTLEFAKRFGWKVGQTQRETSLALARPMHPFGVEYLVAKLALRLGRAPTHEERNEMLRSYTQAY